MEVVMEFVDESRIEWIRYCLLAHFFKEMTFIEKQPRLRIQRLQSLFHAKHDFEEQKQWPEHRLPRGFSPERAEIQLKWASGEDGGTISTQPANMASGSSVELKKPSILHLILPENVRHVLRSTIGRYEEGSHYSGGFYLRLSDTKNRFLRIIFFKSNDPSLHCRIEYLDRPGALADLTQVLKSQDFNILSAYLAPGGERNKTRFELIVRSSRMEGLASGERKKFLEQALSNGEHISDLQIEIGYPQNYGPEWRPHPIRPARSSAPKIQDNYTTWFSDLEKTSLKQRAHFEAQRDPDLEPYWDLAKQLRDKYEDITRTREKKKFLFVSCHYSINQLKTIEHHAKRYGFAVRTGENLVKDPSLTSGLIKKIKESTHFLGVWSSDGAQKLEESWWPSPWLLWEFGVAEAFGLTWRLLIQNDVDQSVWQKLAPHRQHPRFTTVNFIEKLKEVLKILSELPSKQNC